MRTCNLMFVLFLLLITLGCNHATEPKVDREIKKVSINSSEVFEYQTGMSGDEESVTITEQPDHYKTSKIVRDSTTDWEAVYKYQSESGFKGTTHVEIKLASGSDANTTLQILEIEITVN